MIYDSSVDVLKHKTRVAELLHQVIIELIQRICKHDNSKLNEPEKKIFDKYTKDLNKLAYGSLEYDKCKLKMETAIKHHYSCSRHHPEHYLKGVEDMNLIDIIEMLCDWKAASEQHKDGDILKSIEISRKRFGITEQLDRILRNTAADFF